MMLSIDDLKKALNYDSETGWFTWRIKVQSNGGGREVGDRAGTVARGRRQIGYLGRIYSESRLAWAFMTGDWPPKGFDVEHENENGEDNRWSNLRLATRTQNNWNRREPRKDNRSGQTGVSWKQDRRHKKGKWHARICADGKAILLGDFDDLNEAISVRREAEKRYFGEFAPDRT
jgi:hypothetical protein